VPVETTSEIHAIGGRPEHEALNFRPEPYPAARLQLLRLLVWFVHAPREYVSRPPHAGLPTTWTHEKRMVLPAFFLVRGAPREHGGAGPQYYKGRGSEDLSVSERASAHRKGIVGRTVQ